MKSFFNVENVHVVEKDTSPSGRKLFLVWNPPLRNPNQPLEGRVSSLEELVKLIIYFMLKGVRMICFVKVRSPAISEPEKIISLFL